MHKIRGCPTSHWAPFLVVGICITSDGFRLAKHENRSLLSVNEDFEGECNNKISLLDNILFYCSTSATFAIAVGVGVAALQAHSLHLSLPLLLHRALNTACLHVGIGGYFGLDGVPFNHLRKRESYHKKAQNANTYEDNY